MEDLVNEFRSEAVAIVQDVQQKLLLAEQGKATTGLIDDIFRGVHTLKGSSRMFGYVEIEKITHELENILDEIRAGRRQFSKQIISLTIRVMDMVQQILEGNYNQKDYYGLYSLLQVIEEEHHQSVFKNANQFYQIFYKPLPNIYERGIKPLSPIDELKKLGEVLVLERNSGISDAEQKGEKVFETRFEILLHKTQNDEEVEEAFIFLNSEEYAIHTVDLSLDDYMTTMDNNLEAEMGDQNLNESEQAERFAKIMEFVDKLNLVSTQTDTPNEIEFAAGKWEKEMSERGRSTLDYINVKLERLDDMINLMSELVNIKAEFNYHASQLQFDPLTNSVERLEKISTKFKDNAFSMRLVPLQIMALKMQRLVRDNSEKLGKKTNLILEGLNTEIDKSIISEIDGPLMYIIQNALDHGLETPEERKKLGKPLEGTIKIVAFYAGANVFIQIQDDGRGLNLGNIYNKAIANGLIKKEDNLTREEIIKLIFEPGFSSKTSHTSSTENRSGLDSVMSKLRQLRGTVEVNTEEGLGTSFTMRLPLSLSIIDVLHIKVGGINYLLPHNEVVQCLNERINADTIKRDGYNIKFEGKLIPHVNLMEFFDERTPIDQLEDEHSIIILNKNDQFVSIEVESIVGEDQFVIKPIDDALSGLGYLAGMAVLGSGELAYLLDVLKLKEYNMIT